MKWLLLTLLLAGCIDPSDPPSIEETHMEITRVFWTIDVTANSTGLVSNLQTNFLHCPTIWFDLDVNSGTIITRGAPNHANFHYLSAYTGPLEATASYHDQGGIRSPVDGKTYTGSSGSNTRLIEQKGNTFTITESFTSTNLENVPMTIDRNPHGCD